MRFFILLVVLPLFSAVGAFTQFVADDPVASSVEVGLSELSPRGVAGGYAMPASGCSDTSHGPIHDCETAPEPEPPTCSISASDTSIGEGEEVTISWTTQNATGAHLWPNNYSVPAGSVDSGQRTITLSETVTYDLDIWNDNGDTSDCQITITVRPIPTCNLTASDTSPEFPGGPVTISWTSSDAHEATLWRTGASEPEASTIYNNFNLPSGSRDFTVLYSDFNRQNNEFALDVWNDVGSYRCTVMVSIEDQVAPDVSCSASPTSITAGESVTWTSEVIGGSGTTYLWSGTDGLSSNASSVTKSYTTAGTKTATLTVISNGVIVGPVSCDNQVTVAPVEEPNLTSSNLALNTGTLTQGNPVSFIATVNNNGAASTGSGFSDEFRYCWGSGCNVGAGTVISRPSKSVMFVGDSNPDISNTVTLSQSGTLRVQHCVDYNDLIDESNETYDDNCEVTEFTVASAGEPNLTSSNLALNTGTLTQGSTVNFTATVTNNGSVSTGANFFDEFRYCWGSTCNVGSGTLLSRPSKATMSAGASNTDTSNSLPLLQTGTLKVQHCVDWNDQIDESNETYDDNCEVTEFTVASAAQPNLTSSNLALNTGTLTEGSAVTFKATVTNNGAASTGSGFTDEFRYCWGSACTFNSDPDQVISRPNKSAMTAGASTVEYSAYLTLNQTGTLRVQHCVDYNDLIDESNETYGDNCEVTEFTVASAAQPNLTSSNLGVDTGTLAQGNSVTLKATVTNNGSASTGASFSDEFRYCWGSGCNVGAGTVISRPSKSAMAAGASNIDYSSSLNLSESGTLRVQHCVDYNDLIDESNETYGDNCEVTEFTVASAAQPNLTSSNLSLYSGTLALNNSVRFSADVTNNGGVSTLSSFIDEFRYCWGSACDVTSGTVINRPGKTALSASGSTKDYSSSISINQTGTLKIQHCVDYNDLIDESNETYGDNCEVATFNIAAAAQPNLTSSNLDLYSGTLEQGNLVRFRAYVTNNGAASTGNIFGDQFKFCWGDSCDVTNGTVISSPAKPTMASGSTLADYSNYLTLTQTGTLKVQHCVDWSDLVSESDETYNDNCEVTTFTVGAAAQPNLTTTNLSLYSGTLESGNTVSFKANVSNNGSVSTGSGFADEFRYCWGSGCNVGAGTVMNRPVKSILAAGGSTVDYSSNFSLVGTGVLRIQHCVDWNDQIDESNETYDDNCEVTDFNIDGPECSDGDDNDGDGNSDYPNDPGCAGPTDDDESDDPAPAPTVTLEVRNVTTGSGWTGSNITITEGDQVNLRWYSNNATTCNGSNFSTGGYTSDTQTTVSEPSAGNSRTYAVVCTGSGGSANDSLIVTTVGGDPEIEADPGVVRAGDEADVTWNTNGNPPATCSVNGPGINIPALSRQTGGQTVTVYNESTYTITCSAGGQDEATVKVLPVIQET